MTTDALTATPVLVVMGVSGAGKSTLAEVLAERLGWVLQEGDDLHPEANVEKMRAGVPLADGDRWPWLDTVRSWIDDQQAAGRPAIVTCSALRRAYRERIALPGVEFVHLEGRRDELAERLGRRRGHFMPASLLESQLETLEPLAPDEDGFAVSAVLPVQEAADAVIAQLRAGGVLPAG